MNLSHIARVWTTESAVWIELTDGRKAKENFSNYSRLADSSQSQRENFHLSHFGIHWTELDEDLSFDGFFNKPDQ